MANHRLTTILAPETATTATTKTEDILIDDPISQIIVQFKGTNNGSTPTAHPAKMISKIELINGSDVLYSCSGIESQAMSFYDEGRLPHNVLEYRNDVMAIPTFHLNFGRDLWDEQLALLPRQFKQLQIKVTHNKASGGSTPDVGELAIWANVFDEKSISPSGFLMTKEWQSYALASGAWEYIDMPLDHPIRKFLIQSLATDKQPWEQYNEVKLNENNGKKVPIEQSKVSNLLKLYYPNHRITENVEGTGTGSAVDHFCTPTYDTYATLTGFDAATTTQFVNQSYGGTIGISFDNAEHFQSVLSGLAPHGALGIPMGRQEIINDWYNVQALNSLRLEVKGGSSVAASSTAEIVTQQYRRYGAQ